MNWRDHRSQAPLRRISAQQTPPHFEGNYKAKLQDVRETPNLSLLESRFADPQEVLSRKLLSPNFSSIAVLGPTLETSQTGEATGACL